MMDRLAPGLLLIFVLGSARASFAGDKQIDELDAKEYRASSLALGQAKDLDYARAEGLGLVPTSPLDTYLNGILAKLVAQSPVKNVPARAYIRASGDWAAKSTADANIYVALGTLLRLDNEDEVAALLAHEASHIILGHADADIVQGVQQRAIQLSAIAAEARSVFTGGKGKDASAAAKSVPVAARVEEQSRALLLNTMFLTPAWTREQERDADRLGTDLLVRAGYAPQAMASLLRKQKSFESVRAANPEAASIDQQLFGIDTNQKVQEQAKRAARSVGVGSDELGNLAGAVIGKAFEWGSKKVDEAQRSHPKTEERIAAAEAYVASEYADAAVPPLQVETWDDAKDQDGTVEILESYIAAIEAKGKLSEGDVAGALPLAKAGLSGPTRAHAYPNYVDAAVKIAGGDVAAALADYEAALAGPEPAGAIYAEATARHLDAGNSEKAVKLIEAGYARLQEPPSLTVPLIRTYRRVGRQADADRAAAECGLRWPKMHGLCSDEAKGKLEGTSSQ